MNVVGIGTDIIEVSRIADMLSKHGEYFTHRVFTADEVEYCVARAAANQHFAGRWAAKEAVLKALGTGWTRGIKWTDIEVVNLPGGQPIIRLYQAAQLVASEQGIHEVKISISHCRETAIAYAIAVGDGHGNPSS